uniref:protein NipSnap homolog 1-like n=1 Tax=Styela clava TaxID=7725 RepID=UPI001939B862|nr:protein NipSnap homolog 1-like [Styela clava]
MNLVRQISPQKLIINGVLKRNFARSSQCSANVKDFFYKPKPRDSSHSSILTKKEKNHLYKIQFHSVKPGALDEYKDICAEILPKISADPDLPVECVGSWSCWYGDQDQVVHLWRYNGGFPAIGEANQKMSSLEWYKDMRKKRSHMLLGRRNQLLFEFSFWNTPEPRDGPNIYELRTYQLKPGTLIEWANSWARGISNRQTNNEAVGGFFSEIGDLNIVHHLWAYKDLHHRKVTRGKAWTSEGWDNVVYYTVPLIREMKSQIMIPLPHSPLQ